MTDGPRRDAEPWTRVGAYALCRDDGRMLVCRIAPGYPEAGKWTLPGGGVEFGEHPDAAVLRELWEETGLEGLVRRPIGVVSLTIDRPVSRPGPLHAVAIIYEVDVVVRPLGVERDGSTDTCAWMAPERALASPHVDLVDHAAAWLHGHAVPGSTSTPCPDREPSVTSTPRPGPTHVLGRATTFGGPAPFGPDDPLVAARAVRRALAAAGRKASEVDILVTASATAPSPDALRAFAQRALGPHGELLPVRHLVFADMGAEALAHDAAAGTLADSSMSAGSALAVGLGADGTTVALCLGTRPRGGRTREPA